MTPNPVSRRLSAIVVADVVGYTRLMERYEAGTHARPKEIRAQVVDPRIAAYGGRIINTSGDGMLVEFTSATAALRCAIEIQREMGTRNLYVVPEDRIEFRIGINLGDIIIDGDDIAGEGVNVAARLETLAEPGGICIAATVLEHAHEDLGVSFVDIGEQQVKNIVRPIRVYRVTLRKCDTEARAATRLSPQQRSTRRRWLLVGIAALGAIGVGVVLVLQGLKSTASPAPQPNSVAILPFTAPNGSPAEVQLSDVLTQDLTTALGRWRMVSVASPGLAAAYKGRAIDVRTVSRELNVRYVIEGEIRPDAERDVVNTHLVDAGTGVQLWGDQNEIPKAATREERDVLVLRSARRLRNALYDAQSRDSNQSAAMKLLFRADAIDNTSRKGILNAQHLYDEALRLQPDFTLALIARGSNSVAELEFDPGPDRDRLVEEGLGFSARALALDPDNANAWNLRGILLGWQGRLDAAFEADTRARQLDPSLGFNLRAWLLVMNGQANEALVVVERAFSIDPLAVGNYQLQKCWASFLLGRYDEAITACEKWRAIDDGWFPPHVLLMAAYAQSGNAAKAAAEKAIVLRRVPEYSIARYKALWKSDSPAYQSQTEAHIIAGLRKAGIPEQ
jgi:class 3 adenylate cyclase/TolB-like protein